jgi:hypothetical protein
MNPDPVDWLVQEVEDLLGVGNVGLYEFLWLLRPKYPNLNDRELRSYAAQALDRLLQEERGSLVWLIWPHDEVEQGPIEEDSEQIWSDPGDGPYRALAPR